MNKCIIMLTLVFLTGCTTMPQESVGLSGSQSSERDRLIYRDLTRAPGITMEPNIPSNEEDEIKITKASLPSSAPADSPMIAFKAPIYVDFGNDAWGLRSQAIEQLNTLRDTDFPDQHYFIVGHSHGVSSVGVARVAQGRAESIANWMIDNGVDRTRVHQMGAWSRYRDPIAPSKGAQIYVVNEKDGRYLLAVTPPHGQTHQNLSPEEEGVDEAQIVQKP